MPGARPETSAPARPNDDQPPLGQRQARLEPDPGGGRAGAAGGILLDRQRAGERERLCAGFQRNVHARLLTVSFTLEVVAIVAAGSKPEWIPQCSQRWSLPGP